MMQSIALIDSMGLKNIVMEKELRASSVPVVQLLDHLLVSPLVFLFRDDHFCYNDISIITIIIIINILVFTSASFIF